MNIPKKRSLDAQTGSEIIPGKTFDLKNGTAFLIKKKIKKYSFTDREKVNENTDRSKTNTFLASLGI